MTVPFLYFDHSTASFPSEETIKKMVPFFKNFWGSSLSPHFKGQELIPFMEEAYSQLYRLIGADTQDHFTLTSSGTEAINHVIHSVYRNISLATGKNHFVTAATDEAASTLAITQLEKLGCLHTSVEVNSAGIVTVEALSESISARTALVSLSWGNGLTGSIQPIAEIASFCQERGIQLHVDATHVLGKLPVDLQEIPIDYLTFNGSQLHGPVGTGGLYIRQGIVCTPLLVGGSEQGNQRAGQLNLPGLVGLASAAIEATDQLDLIGTETARLRNKLETELAKIFPIEVCYKNQPRLPHCTTIIFPKIMNEALLFLLNRKKICATIGGGNFQQLPLLLLCSGIEEKRAHSSLSFSLSRYTTEEEIDLAVQATFEAAQTLAKCSEKLYL